MRGIDCRGDCMNDAVAFAAAARGRPGTGSSLPTVGGVVLSSHLNGASFIRLPWRLRPCSRMNRPFSNASSPESSPPSKPSAAPVAWTTGDGSGRPAVLAPSAASAACASYFFSKSRISRSSSTSSAGAAGGGGGAFFFSRLICLTMMKMMNARMTKLIATVMKLP